MSDCTNGHKCPVVHVSVFQLSGCSIIRFWNVCCTNVLLYTCQFFYLSGCTTVQLYKCNFLNTRCTSVRCTNDRCASRLRSSNTSTSIYPQLYCWWVMILINIPIFEVIPDSKVHGTNMGPTWVLSAPVGPHVGPMNLAIKDDIFIATPLNMF